jgi:uncharacterized membrane protein YgdD (TMEM256/DUF423 family)
MARTEPSGLDSLFRLLVAYRLLVYFGGLFVIGLPLLFRALGTELSGTARTVLVVVTLAVMVLTYLGERRVGYAESRSESATEEYSLQIRLVFALALVGIAVGIYVALEVNTFTGLLFIVGAYLFGYMGYRSGFDREEG